jgi:hypothetical protein
VVGAATAVVDILEPTSFRHPVLRIVEVVTSTSDGVPDGCFSTIVALILLVL